MAEWEKLKVTELKEELKSRGVALTGLKLKQQLIDKLNELDTENPKPEDEEVVQSPRSEKEVVQRIDTIGSKEVPSQGEDSDKHPSDERRDTEEEPNKIPEDLPTELKQEESQAKDEGTPPPVMIETAHEKAAVQKDDPFVIQSTKENTRDNTTAVDALVDIEATDAEKVETSSEKIESSIETSRESGREQSPRQDVQNLQQDIGSISRQSSQPPDDQRKRKRQDSTATSELEETASKRPKANDDTPAITQEEANALEGMKQANASIQATLSESRLQSTSDPAHDNIMADVQERPSQHTPRRSSGGKALTPPVQRLESPRSMSPSDRDVPSATHPATSSLYIRNFKRPLHIPTLRNHISTLSKSDESEPLRIFYLDNIRTHAFVSFKSISAASRVRNAMHGARFPDEPMREPLWVDFVPDEKVQPWIDEETGSASGAFGGGKGSSKKYEVAYEDDGDGQVEAILQEATNRGTSNAQRPGFTQMYSSRLSASQDPTASGSVASGIHPSRAALVAPEPINTRASPKSTRLSSSQAKRNGDGFGALDELFSSTTTKPKLYFKLVPPSVIEEREEMIQRLRIGHDQMGRSGDEGMKRYSFESEGRYRKQEWVDKGPEFGFGRRGHERLTGFGTHYSSGPGIARGRGGFRGSRRGGDSWRGR